MKERNKNLISKKKGVSLIEITLALLILALTFLPIIGVIGTSSKDTDVANSYVFAQTTARNILDTLLDDVPFNSIIANPSNENIAKLVNYGSGANTYEIGPFQDMIGTTDENASGEIIDERGTKYTIKLYVFPIPVAQSMTPSENEIVFAYQTRPEYETTDNWYKFDNTKDSSCYIDETAKNPYDITTYETATQTFGAFALGAKQNKDTTEYYIMKKILLKITWIGRDNHARSLDIYTLKANLDQEKFN